MERGYFWLVAEVSVELGVSQLLLMLSGLGGDVMEVGE